MRVEGMNLVKNIVLVGMPGCGKTTVGRELARQTGRPFFDTDTEIEIVTGFSIARVLDTEGEAGFRNLESRLLRRLCRKRDIVLSTGGGVPLRDENVRIMRQCGLIVYLRADLDLLRGRLAGDTARPLLKQPGALEAMFAARTPRYEQSADVTVQVSDGPPVAQAKELLAIILSECSSGRPLV